MGDWSGFGGTRWPSSDSDYLIKKQREKEEKGEDEEESYDSVLPADVESQPFDLSDMRWYKGR